MERRVRQIAIDDKRYMRPSVDTTVNRTTGTFRHCAAITLKSNTIVAVDIEPSPPQQNGMQHSPPVVDKSKKKPPALTYTKPPWELTIRKEVPYLF